MAEQKNSSLLNKVGSEAGLVLIPFFFTLIVFMYQVGKFFFYDIPLQHISISLGELFSFWFGFFIAVGLIGFGVVNFIVGTIQAGRLEKFFNVVLFQPSFFFVMYFLLTFPIAPFKVSLILSGCIALLYLLNNLQDAWTDKNKQFTFWERIVSNRAKAKYESTVQHTVSTSWWDKLNESYYLGFFCVYVVLGVPCKIGYLLESTTTRHWVDATNQQLILIQTQNEFHLLKEYDLKEKTLKPGYLIRPVSDSEMKYVEIDTGEIKKVELK